MGLLLMFFISFCFCVSSSSPVGRTVQSDSHLENNFGLAGSYDHDNNRINGAHDQNGRSGIVHSSKFAHGTGAVGARGGGGSGTTETANGNGESNGAGAESVPSTASSTSNDNRHPNTRHNAASCLRSSIMFPTLILVVFASAVVHLYV